MSSVDKIAKKFVAGKDMNRPLRDYIFDYLTHHPEHFSRA